MAKTSNEVVGAADPIDSKYQPKGFFNLSSTAKVKIDKKRKKKGLGEMKPKKVATSTQVFVSCGAAVLSKSLLLPFERLRTILQVSHLANYHGNTRPSGAFSLLPKIIQEQGISALYRGNMTMIYMTLSKMMVNITLYDKYKKRIMPAGDHKYTGFNKLWRRAAAALAGGATTILFSYPFELLFTRITADMGGKSVRRLYTNSFDCFNLTQIESGMRGLYQGSLVALANTLPSTLIMLPLYETLSSQNKKSDDVKTKMAKVAGSKLAASVITMLLVYPLDTIKHCKQVVGSRGYQSLDTSILNVISGINKAYGIRGFYRGVHLALFRAFPAFYLQMVLYDYLKQKSALVEKEPVLDLANIDIEKTELSEQGS